MIKDAATFEHDEKQKQVLLTEYGSETVEQTLEAAGHLADGSAGLYDPANISVVHHVNQALRANILYLRDRDYIVRSGEVMLIDEFTGRMMHGRRLSEGLHQAIEAKEQVDIQPENQTLASVTIQNYFRLYEKLSGMTGTAATEAQEFFDIYKMDVAEIPTNRPVARKDADDEVYRTAAEKNQAIISQIVECHQRDQPVLVGTVSIEKSEQLSELLKAHVWQNDGKTVVGVPHSVLNARYHEQEAFIVADAGVPGTVTIATNMAGRGTDIQLGGNLDMRLARWRTEQGGLGIEPSPEAEREARAEIEAEIEAKRVVALAAGGLFVLGTERHESRRIDNQLRGRTGRQGDPGQSKFFLSCEDDLLRIFAGDRLDAIMRTFGVEEGEAITHRWLNSAIATAQKRVEQRNYEIRKNLLKYDDVVNDQRKAVFEQRREFMESDDLSVIVTEMRHDTIDDLVARHLPPKAYADQWDIEGLDDRVCGLLGLSLPLGDWAAEEGIGDEEIRERLVAAADARAAEREELISSAQTRGLEKNFLLQMVDMQWREHLMHLDHLRNVIGLRGYGQRDPAQRVQDRGFLALRDPDRRPAPERHPLADDRRDPVHTPRSPPRAAGNVRSSHGSADRRERESAGNGGNGDGERLGGAARRLADLGPPRRLRTHRPQRPLPLRIGPQVQALPRRAGLASDRLSLPPFGEVPAKPGMGADAARCRQAAAPPPLRGLPQRGRRKLSVRGAGGTLRGEGRFQVFELGAVAFRTADMATEIALRSGRDLRHELIGHRSHLLHQRRGLLDQRLA